MNLLHVNDNFVRNNFILVSVNSKFFSCTSGTELGGNQGVVLSLDNIMTISNKISKIDITFMMTMLLL